MKNISSAGGGSLEKVPRVSQMAVFKDSDGDLRSSTYFSESVFADAKFWEVLFPILKDFDSSSGMRNAVNSLGAVDNIPPAGNAGWMSGSHRQCEEVFRVLLLLHNKVEFVQKKIFIRKLSHK